MTRNEVSEAINNNTTLYTIFESVYGWNTPIYDYYVKECKAVQIIDDNNGVFSADGHTFTIMLDEVFATRQEAEDAMKEI